MHARDKYSSLLRKSLNYAKYCELLFKLYAKLDQLSSIFQSINKSWQKSACIWWIFQVILAIFSINLSDFYQNKWNITKSNKISWSLIKFHEVLLYFSSFRFR